MKRPTSTPDDFDSGGEGGIRTLDTFRYTRFPSVRTRPDYATSPLIDCAIPLTGGHYTTVVYKC